MSKIRATKRRAAKLASKDGAELLQLGLANEFQPTKLPLLKDVLARVYTIYDDEKSKGRDGTSQFTSYEDAIQLVSDEVRNHWIQRNVYPVSKKHVKTKLKARFSEYKTLKNTGAAKRKQPSYIKKCSTLNIEMEKLFDIFCEDKTQRQYLETSYGEQMKDEDFKFLESMRNDRRRGKY